MKCKSCKKELGSKSNILSSNCCGSCLECAIKEGNIDLAIHSIKNLEAKNKEYLEELCNISNMCIGNLAMGYPLDAGYIGESIYEATGMANPQLNDAVCKSLSTK